MEFQSSILSDKKIMGKIDLYGNKLSEGRARKLLPQSAQNFFKKELCADSVLPI